MSERVSGGWEEGEVYEGREERLAAFAAKLKMRPEDADVFVRNGYGDAESIPKHPRMRREMLRYLKKNETAPATWMVLSGLWPEFERGMPSDDRRRRVRAVYKSAVLLIRRELKKHEIDPEKAERGIYWDPVVEVCRALEISQSKLSGFCRELTGNSLIQVIDNVRAEGLGKKLRAGVREFLRARCASSGTAEQQQPLTKTLRTQRNHKEEKEGVWAELKESRKEVEFSRDTWAMGLGFSSYRKLYRACLCVFGKTVAQMEIGLIEEALRGEEEEGVMGGLGEGAREWTLEEVEAELKGVRVVDWEGGG